MARSSGILKLRRAGGTRYRIRWVDAHGKRRSETYGSESAARAALRRHQVEADDVRSGRARAPGELTPLFADYLDDVFLPALREPRVFKASERATTEGIVRRHLRPRFGAMRLDEITRPVGIAFSTELARLGLAPKSVHNVLLLLTRILRDAKEREVLAEAPTFKVGKAAKRQQRQYLEPIRRAEYLDGDELEALVAAAVPDPLLHAMILVAARGGLRSGELRGLRWGDVDFRGGTITVARNEYRGTIDTPKSGLARTVPLAGRVRAALEALGRGLGDGAVFPFSEKAMTLRLVGAAARAGIRSALEHRVRMRECRRAAKLRKAGKPLSPEQAARVAAYDGGTAVRFGWHTLRHTFCSHLAMQGTAALKIKEWAGHADLQTTQRYMHLAPVERNAAAAIDALDPSPTSLANVVPIRS